MTSYTTCINCAADKKGCVRRKAIQSAIRGTGITSVKFRCTDRVAIFLPGQRVSITWTVGNDPYEVDETWPGTIIAENGSKFIVSVDDVDSDEGTPARDYIRNEQLFVKVSPSRIRRIDEPDRSICDWCQKAPGPDDACQERSTDTWWHMVGNCPPGCIVAARA